MVLRNTVGEYLQFALDEMRDLQQILIKNYNAFCNPIELDILINYLLNP